MKRFLVSAATGAAVVGLSIALTGTSVFAARSDDANTQTAELYQLQAAFHRAASVRDNINGDSPAVIDSRIRDMLSLWAADGSLTLLQGNPNDGVYEGRGDLESDCAPPSSDPSNRGTMCTFFKYVAGSFKPQNRFVSLSPAFKTQFDIHGNTADIYYECHYFNVAPGADGKPLWTSVSHAEAKGTVKKVDGVWLFDHLDAPIPPVPLGS